MSNFARIVKIQVILKISCVSCHDFVAEDLGENGVIGYNL